MKTTDTHNLIYKREVKSFVRRQRRLTLRLEKALHFAWPEFGIDIQSDKTPLDLNAVFGRNNPKILEIGFGHGDTVLPMAIAHPEYDYLGIEVHEPGVAAVMMGIIEHDVKNIRVIQDDAIKVVRELISENAFSRIQIYFPDPWPKKRHHKRRMVQSHFVDMVRQKLCDDGILHFATDWQDYAEHMMRVLSENSGLENCMGEHQFADNRQLQLRANTKFENRGKQLGHGVWDVLFRKLNQTHTPTRSPSALAHPDY